ncbi:hypothetical protein [Mesorhizobium sp. ES1-1]|uniref:hypothetical protein n=1 Tax=Mesorhizobium sp. ES1-1 TaxID=2876629 RepID=UPI001CCFCC3B|nr:hypothetical protein [Mesorhizobium sp. ES1-1]MBZ9678271.1 hypothetical protein [Mesorhizobium sp. ES1-1]
MTIALSSLWAGLGDDNPYPLRLPFESDDDPNPGIPKPQQVSLELGRGEYTCTQIGPIVTLNATGIMKCMNSEASLVLSPLAIFPPIYGLYFTVPTFCLDAIRPFTVTQTFLSKKVISKLDVYDAGGRHEVPISQFGNWPLK